MTKIIILSEDDVCNLFNDKPVKLYVDQIPHVLCTDKYYKHIRNKDTDGQPRSDIEEIREVMSCDADAETKCKMISNILTANEDKIKEEKEEQLKKLKEKIEKLKAELDYAKFRCALPSITDMMHRN